MSFPAVDRPPTAFKKSVDDKWVVPWVSNASGWKMWVAGRSAYLEVFLLAAASAAPPADWDDRWTYEYASVVTTVTSQVSGLPACNGVRVSPSGRLPSVLVKPLGSFITGTSTVVKDRAMTSLIAWCLVILLGACYRRSHEGRECLLAIHNDKYGRHIRCNQDAKWLPHGLHRQKVSAHS